MTTPSDKSYREITLSKGLVALVDCADYDWLSRYKWHATPCRGSVNFYAARSEYVGYKKSPLSIRMHREILGLKPGDGLEGEHIDPRGTLDNRRSNLRIATPGQNGCNKHIIRSNTSGYKGVSLHRETGKWLAQIQHNHKNQFLGLFMTKEAAHSAYCSAATRLHGEFARFE